MSISRYLPTLQLNEKMYKILNIILLQVFWIQLILRFVFTPVDILPHISTYPIVQTRTVEQLPTLQELKQVQAQKKIQEFNELITSLESIKEYDRQAYILAYKKAYRDYDEYVMPFHSVYDEYTDEEIELFQRAVETETHDGDFDSKVNVANVILNRVANTEFSDINGSLSKVITRKNQFAYHRTEIDYSTVLAIEYAFLFEDTTDGALWFDTGLNSWAKRNRTFVFKDDIGHVFYK